MTIHTKAIAKAEKTIQDAIDKIEAQLAEAKSNFWDTGYDRYYNKIHICEEAITELTEYVDARRDVKRYRRRIRNMEAGIALYKQRLDELKRELLGDMPEEQLNYIIERCKTRLDLAMDEAERS